MGNDRRLRWLMAGAAGGLAGLALPPLGWPPLLWASLAMLWSLAGSPPPALLTAGALWGSMAVLVSHRWLLGLHPLTWIGVPAPISLPICLLLLGLLAGLGGLLVMGWLSLIRRLDGRRLGTALFGSALWGLGETVLARGPLFWLGLGASALPGDPPLAGLASLGGAGLVAAFQLLVGWGLWRWLASPRPRRTWPLALVVLLLAGHLAGSLMLASADAPTKGDAGTDEAVLVIQPAIPTREKFTMPQQRRLLDQLAMALDSIRPEGEGEQEGPQRPVTTVLLPEGALPLGQPLPRQAPVEVLSGGFRIEGEALRSAVLRFAPGEQQPSSWIDKRRVVPLGEWVPFAGLVRWSGLSAVGGIEPGASSRLMGRGGEPGGAAPIAVAICYEISDGVALARASRNGARWILATANLDPYPLLLQRQFMALSRLRAIETGRWLVSSANTGPSLLVNPRGQVKARIPAGESATAVLVVKHRGALTPYARWGEAPLLVLLLAGLPFGAMIEKRSGGPESGDG